ncbi:MFS transporter [Microbacterium sp. 2C]|uniref:MFS transporter n=1 Tax=Microbacterium paulum TaxID=2707006 RepID=UPI0018C259FD|nr:MFS transporter [Microbacterium paulum]MBG0716662.1 MFS transporter [Microbacterium paulum]
MPRSSLWLTALFIATLSLGTDEFVIAGVLNTVAADLDVTPGAAGQLVTGFAFAFALGAPVLAVWLDRYPRRLVLFGGLSVFVLANLGCAIAPDLTTLFILRIVAGLSAAAVSTTAFAAAAEGAPEGNQGTYLSVVTAGLTVALFTGVPVGTWLAGAWGWRATFVLIAIVAALAAIIALTTMPRLPGAKPGTLGERLAPLRNPGVLRMVAAIFLCGTGGLMFYTYLGPITLHTLGTDTAMPILLLTVGLVGVVSALLGGRLTDRFGPRRARLAILGGHALALSLVAVLVIVTGAPVWVFGITVGIWSVFAWALNPPMQASTIAAAPDAAMTAVSLNISGLYLGTAVAGAIGGLTLDHLGASAIPIVGAIALAAAWLVAAPRIKNSTPLHQQSTAG